MVRVLNTQAACRTLALLPALSSIEFRFADRHTLYDFGAVLQLIEARDALQGHTRGGRRLEVQWSVELGNTCAQRADGSSTQRLCAVRLVVAPVGLS
eukprot:COSAG02_NODE_2678_length_8262_cov_5.072400_2_plen_97_part_00